MRGCECFGKSESLELFRLIYVLCKPWKLVPRLRFVNIYYSKDYQYMTSAI